MAKKSRHIFNHTHLKNIKVTSTFFEFVSASKNSTQFIKLLLRSSSFYLESHDLKGHAHF